MGGHDASSSPLVVSRGESAGVSSIKGSSLAFFEVPHTFDGVLPLDDGWSRRGGTRREKWTDGFGSIKAEAIGKRCRRSIYLE